MRQPRAASFAEILPVWRNDLWPGRRSPIEPVSPLDHHLRFNPGLRAAAPTFFLVEGEDGRILGTISGYRTDETYYRCRGLFVAETARRRGLAAQLLHRIAEQGRREGCGILWSLPRREAFPAYEAVGFARVSPWITEGMEFGPNCVATKSLLK